MKVVKLKHGEINLFKITESMCSVRLKVPVLFIQLLEKNLGKKYIHQDKGSNEHYLGFGCRGWHFILEK